MEKIVGVVGLVAVLVLVGWGVPPRYRLIAIAGGLAFAVLILAIEQAGFSGRPGYSRCRLRLDGVFVCEKVDGGERP